MLNYARSWAHRLALNSMIPLAVTLPLIGDVSAQTVVSQPVFTPSRQWIDLGNGPLDLQPVEGNGNVYSSSGAGVGNTSGLALSTSLLLTATPLIVPCVGCLISGQGITSGTTILSWNGGTQIVLPTSMNVPSGSIIGWGAACPAATAANVPGVAPGTITANQLSPPLPVRAGVGGTFPMYTQARLCAWGAFENGFTLLYFAIGAH